MSDELFERRAGLVENLSTARSLRDKADDLIAEITHELAEIEEHLTEQVIEEAERAAGNGSA